MTDNKLTDIKEYHIKEIIRTLESNSTPFSKVIVDLINRLQAQNEVYETCNARKDEAIKSLESRLKKLQMQFDDISKMYSEIKAEAYKEFAEKLKNEIISDTAYGCDTNQHTGYYDYQIKIGDIPEYIDNLLKELVGEDK